MHKLSDQQIEHFVASGYVKIENAFSREQADTCRSILWQSLGLSPNRPDTWIEPVIRIEEISLEPFIRVANTPTLTTAFTQLAFDNWEPPTSIGGFPIRFPCRQPAMDTGWHVDASFPGDVPEDYFEWNINIQSRGRSLLMLFLFSDTTAKDAPTRLSVGSHIDVAQCLAPYGSSGLTFVRLSEKIKSLPKRKEAIATGDAGTVYLCHPFLVHAAQDHKGLNPRFMAQTALVPKRDFNIWQTMNRCCPIEKAIKAGIVRP